MPRSASPTPTAPLADPLDQGSIGALINGRHGAPFDVLGSRLVDVNGVRTWIVRTFLPGARAVWVVPDRPGSEDGAASLPERIHMQQLHPYGLFSMLLPSEVAPAYHFDIEGSSGAVGRAEDPYTFPPLLSGLDLYLIGEGKHQQLHDHLGAHPAELNGVAGTDFAVWAPNARRVSVVGDFNSWDDRVHPMRMRSNGVWELFLPNVAPGALYKYAILSWNHDYRVLKADPFAFAAELRPGTASRVWDLNGYVWGDTDWMTARADRNDADSAITIYEVHAGSWRAPSEPHGQVTYRELAHQLVPYVKDLGFTHIELMPVAEHPFDGSWGYQITGYFAPTSRYGAPQDFMYFVDYCHQHGIGVLLDWVPAHFPKDEHGLNYFDGTHLYEHADPRQGEHPDWGTLVFNYGRNEVRNFLLTNALFWIEKYHVDGLRVDAVASMLYLDYSREQGEWLPNQYGGRENLDAVSFIRECNATVHARHPGVLMVAEESTSWPYVSTPVSEGGLGFSFKWNMGWMHDVLAYFHYDPIYRSYHHNELTFSMMYAYSEKFILPFSHDEVVHMKGSLLNKMPGDRWQRFANLRALYGYMYAHPGKKLVFMGGELAQWSEWNFAGYLDWFVLDPAQPDGPEHAQVRDLVRDLNRLVRAHPSLYTRDFHPEGFEWIDGSDTAHSVLAFLRLGPGRSDPLLVVCNFTPVPHHGYRIGTPIAGRYDEMLNTDSAVYGGSNVGNLGGTSTDSIPMHGRPQSLSLTLPPLATIILRPRDASGAPSPSPGAARRTAPRRPRAQDTGGPA
jgi:1,4-alpha-glucan branching enzyme